MRDATIWRGLYSVDESNWDDDTRGLVECLEDEVSEAERELQDARSALLYIRETQGSLYGVGWDRVLPEHYMAETRKARGES